MEVFKNIDKNEKMRKATKLHQHLSHVSEDRLIKLVKRRECVKKDFHIYIENIVISLTYAKSNI